MYELSLIGSGVGIALCQPDVRTGVGSIHDAEDIGDIVKIADKRMYEFKRNYYAKTGKDRRQYQKK